MVLYEKGLPVGIDSHRRKGIECRVGYRRTYGIAAIDREDGEKIILGAVVDVAENREKVEQLAERFNKEKVALERFREAVEDFVDKE